MGKELEVLVEGTSEESELVLVGRHRGQAPEIDGCVYLSGEPVAPGQLVRVTVTQATDYDLLGEVDEDSLLADAPAARRGSALVHHGSDGRRVLRTVS